MFQGGQLRFGLNNLSKSSKADLLSLQQRYSPGTSLLIHYDPDTPNKSVIQPGLNGSIFQLALFGLVLLIGNIALFAHTNRQKHRR